jgi:hypothetical protein
VEDSKNQRLIFTFSNSGVVQTYTLNLGLIAKLSPYQDKFPPTFSSSKIVQTTNSGFELISDDLSEPTQWMNILKEELNMPSNALLRHLTISGSAFGIRWRNYNLRFLGMLVEESNQSEGSCPYWRVADINRNDLEYVQVWYQRVSCMKSPVYCDVRWHPEYGETVKLIGVENAKNGRDVNLAWRGWTLLQKIQLQGRPFESLSLSESQFLECAPQVCRKLFDTFGEIPTDVQIAEELHISRATFYRYLRRYNLSLSQIRDMAFNIQHTYPVPF